MVKFVKIPLLSLSLILSGCIAADLGYVTSKANSVRDGASYDEIVNQMGSPDKEFVNPQDKDMTYLHYCIFGLASDDENGFFLYKGKSYERTRGVSTAPDSVVYEDFSNGVELNCYGATRIDWSKAPVPPEVAQRSSQIKVEDYYVDGLIVRHTADRGVNCTAGSVFKIEISGSIGPDSSFVLEELLKKSPNCTGSAGELIHRTVVSFSSQGGLLKDGYKMGELLRAHRIHAMVENESICASSCAVAFLGGEVRDVGDKSFIVFHSPYRKVYNSLGEESADCDLETKDSIELLNYYQRMTDRERGKRLMDRTLSYCSSSDGWVLQGGASSRLFGVSTQ